MLEALITSKTRLKLLLKFFLNPENTAYLRGLVIELSESTNSIRVELNRLEKANMLHSSFKGNKKYFKVNTTHPLFNDLQAIVHKYVGIDVIIERVLSNLGKVDCVYLVGDLALGKNTESIDLLINGEINEDYLKNAIIKVEQIIDRSINYKLVNEIKSTEVKKGLKIFSTV